MGFIVANGGFRQFTFKDLTLLARWAGEDIQGDLRIEQQPGLWLSVRGSVPIRTRAAFEAAVGSHHSIERH